MLKVLMINMATKDDLHENFLDYNPPLGILSIATFLELHGYECKVIDYCYEPFNVIKLRDLIVENNIKIVTFSVYTINIDVAIKTAKFLKNYIADLKIIFGGPHATLDSEYCYSSRYVDYVIMKEGESTLLELLEAINYDETSVLIKNIKGLTFKKGKEVFFKGNSMFIKNLDLLPIVKREIMGLNNYKHTVNISSSRGCPSNCIYCAGTAMSGGNYRIRNIENVILEVILLSVQMSEDVKTIYFIDDTFTIFRDRVECFIELREKLGIKYKWRCESRIDAMDEEIIDKITENGCYAIQFGIESGSQSVLNNIRKNINLDYAQKIIKYISTKNVLVCLYLMLGHYCDTKETMDLTYQFIKDTVTKYNVDVSLHYNTPYPGTWQYTHRDRLGMKLVSDNYKDFLGYEPIVETSQFTVQDQYDYYFRCKEYLNINGFGYYDN